MVGVDHHAGVAEFIVFECESDEGEQGQRIAGITRARPAGELKMYHCPHLTLLVPNSKIFRKIRHLTQESQRLREAETDRDKGRWSMPD